MRAAAAFSFLALCAAAAAAADLITAIQEGDAETVIAAIEADGNCVNSRSRAGMTPLHYAACYNQMEIAWRLVEAGADVNAATPKYDLTPAHCAADKNAVDVLRFLISKGADVDSRASNGWTPLHFAARGGRRESIRCLIRANADPDAADNGKFTPLHVAAASGNAVTIAALLEAGANPRIENAAGKTAREIASGDAAKRAFAPKRSAAVRQAKTASSAHSAPRTQPAAIGQREVGSGSAAPPSVLSRTAPPGGVRVPPRDAERAILYLNTDGSERYEGGFRRGRKHGPGVYRYAGGATLSANWESDAPHGPGVYTAPDGTSISGYWHKGHFIEGSGTFTTSDGMLYSGTWCEGYLQTAVPLE